MTRNIVQIATIILIVISPLAAAAQDVKPARIGLLRSSEPPAANLAAFRQGMRDRGHLEGKTYVLVPGWLKRGEKRIKDMVLAKRLVAKGVDLIVTVGARMTSAAARASPGTPIVMASTAHPPKELVKSLAAPGGNVTGMSSAAFEGIAKGIEILKQIAPHIRRVAGLHRKRPNTRNIRGRFRKTDEKTAKALNIEIVGHAISGTDDFDAVFRRLKSEGVDALSFRTGSGYTLAQRRRMAEAAVRAGLPTVSTVTQMVKVGSLLSVGTSRTWLFRRSTAYVDLILKGAKPGELPVETPSAFQVVINLKTAKALGLKIPVPLLLRADELIK